MQCTHTCHLWSGGVLVFTCVHQVELLSIISLPLHTVRLLRPVVTWRTLSRSCLRLAPVCLNTRCQSADCICRCRWSHFNDLSLTAAGKDSSGIWRELNSSPSVLKKPSEERSVLFKISPRLLSPMKIKSERERQKWEKGSDRIENEGQRERERERPVQRHKRYSERERATKIDRKCKNDSVCESHANQACNKEAPPQWVIKALPWFA